MMLQDRNFAYLTDVAKLTLVLVSIVVFLIINLRASTTQASESSKELFDINHAQTEIVVGTTDQNKRIVNLSISYPSGHKSSHKDVTLVVFSHGHALDNQSYHNLTNYWVARGYFVVAPMHLDSGGDLKAVSIISKKFGNDWIAASRLLDLNAVIDQIDGIVTSLPDFNGSVSTDRIIAAGHSYGALSSQQLAGAKLEQHGDSIYPIPESLVDPRVVAVVAISPPGLMKDHLSEATWQGFDTPQLVVTGPNDFFPFIWPSYEEHFVSYLTAQEGDNYLLVLDEMNHYLGNLIGRLERDDSPQTLALENLQEISTQFMQHYLDLAPSVKSDLEQSRLLIDVSKHIDKEGVLQYKQR